MNFEELHNELNDFPEDLKYSDARWDEALAVIEAHEAKVAGRKKAGALLCAVALICGAVAFFPFNQETLSKYSPREMSSQSAQLEPTEESSSRENVISKKVPQSDENNLAEATLLDFNKTETPDREGSGLENHEKPEASVLQASDAISSEVIEKTNTPLTDNTPASGSELAGSKTQGQISVQSAIANGSETDKADEGFTEDGFILENSLTNQSASNNNDSPVKNKNQEETDGDLTESPNLNPLFLTSEVNYNQGDARVTSNVGGESSIATPLLQPALNRMQGRSSYLNFTLPRKQLSSDKKILGGDKTFRIYREFIGGKVGMNPLANYGRTELFGSTNPSLGMFYENAISEKVFWNAGLEYFNISSIYLPVSSQETSFNYGFESNITTVHTDRAHFISAPIYLGIRPFKRLQLKAGGSVNVLLETQNTLEEHHVTNENSTLLNQSNTRGYRTSFNSLGFTAAAAMNYWFSERTSVQFTYHYGLSDFSRNEAFGNQTVTQNTRLEVSINRVLR